MSKLGYKPDGSKGGVKVIKQGFNVDPILQKQADCVSTMTYNEYWQVIDGGFKPSQLVVFKYEDEGVATLEDGLYVLEKNLKDPKKCPAPSVLLSIAAPPVKVNRPTLIVMLPPLPVLPLPATPATAATAAPRICTST